MSNERLTLTVRVKDMASVRLLYVSLRLLADRMRVEANPRAEELENILRSYDGAMSDGGPDDGDERGNA